jgi:T5orf172 domain
MTAVREEEVDEQFHRAHSTFVTGYPTPLPSPSLPRSTPVRKPVQSITYPPQQRVREPSLQLSPPPSIPPPTPPESIESPSPPTKPLHKTQKNKFAKFGKAIRKLFHSNVEKPPRQQSAVIYQDASLGTAFRRNDVGPSRYPQTISPTGLPNIKPSTPPSPHKSAQKQSLQSVVTSNETKMPPVTGRPPTSVLLLAQSRSATNGVQRSWETMWVPGIAGLGAHIICKGILPSDLSDLEWISPNLTALGRQKILSCMRAPLSAGEEPGYIYAYKISEDSSKENYYKIGRTQNLTRRLYQWSRSCPYTPLLIEFFPSPSTLRRSSSSSSISSVFKREEPEKMVRCAVTHRVERLIHLELEDRFGRADIMENCICGKIHKEWFHGGNDWNEIREVIVRWVGFARIAYGENMV